MAGKDVLEVPGGSENRCDAEERGGMTAQGDVIEGAGAKNDHQSSYL